MQYYFVEPNDVWMFRDARPFTAGADFAARSVFPPTPQTMQGAIRTGVMEQRGVNWTAGWAARLKDPALLTRLGFTAAGEATQFGDFSLHGPFVGCQTGQVIEMRIPLPLDTFVEKNGSLTPLQPSKSEPISNAPSKLISNAPPGWKPLVKASVPDGGSEDKNMLSKPSDDQFWLDARGIEAWSRGQVPTSAIAEGSLFGYEERTGLAMDSARRTYRPIRPGAQEGMMYRARFVRLQSDVGLLFGASEPVLTTEGSLLIGGESHVGHYRAVTYTPPRAVLPAHGRVKVALTTPAWFSKGWHPKDIFKALFGEGVELVSAVLGKPQPIGGWNMQQKTHKPLANYVPAGSVYFFENVSRLPDAFTETPANALDHVKLGFGAAVFGSWDYQS